VGPSPLEGQTTPLYRHRGPASTALTLLERPTSRASQTRAPSGIAARNRTMLSELRVENLLLIEQAQLRLAPGLNVLTGETGAGKTVLAHALDLLLGGRARAGIVRPGAHEAYVEGVFDLKQGEAPLQASI